jgi:photosystem II stability/assembly factor-like uncharacterized protein
MNKINLSIFRSLALGYFLVICASGLAGSYFESSNQDILPPEISVLGRIPSDGGDPTVGLHIWGEKGLLIRTKSLWSTDDGGNSWSIVDRGTRGRKPTSFESAWTRNGTDILVVEGGSVFQSTDRGRNWSKNGVNTTSTGNFSSIAGNEAGTWWAAVGQQSLLVSQKTLKSLPKYANDTASTSQSPRMLIPALIVSENDGKSWRHAKLPKEFGPLDRVTVSGEYAVALGPYAVFTSTDRGKSWSAPKWESSEREEEYPLSAAIFGNRFWVSLKNGTLLTGELLTDKPSVLSKSSGALDGLTFTNLCVGFALMEDDVVETKDGGVTWVQVTHSKNVTAFSVTQSMVFIATHDQVLQVRGQYGEGAIACVGR